MEIVNSTRLQHPAEQLTLGNQTVSESVQSGLGYKTTSERPVRRISDAKPLDPHRVTVVQSYPTSIGSKLYEQFRSSSFLSCTRIHCYSTTKDQSLIPLYLRMAEPAEGRPEYQIVQGDVVEVMETREESSLFSLQQFLRGEFKSLPKGLRWHLSRKRTLCLYSLEILRKAQTILLTKIDSIRKVAREMVDLYLMIMRRTLDITLDDDTVVNTILSCQELLDGFDDTDFMELESLYNLPDGEKKSSAIKSFNEEVAAYQKSDAEKKVNPSHRRKWLSELKRLCDKHKSVFSEIIYLGNIVSREFDREDEEVSIEGLHSVNFTNFKRINVLGLNQGDLLLHIVHYPLGEGDKSVLVRVSKKGECIKLVGSRDPLGIDCIQMVRGGSGGFVARVDKKLFYWLDENNSFLQQASEPKCENIIARANIVVRFSKGDLMEIWTIEAGSVGRWMMNDFYEIFKFEISQTDQKPKASHINSFDTKKEALEIVPLEREPRNLLEQPKETIEIPMRGKTIETPVKADELQVEKPGKPETWDKIIKMMAGVRFKSKKSISELSLRTWNEESAALVLRNAEVFGKSARIVCGWEQSSQHDGLLRIEIDQKSNCPQGYHSYKAQKNGPGMIQTSIPKDPSATRRAGYKAQMVFLFLRAVELKANSLDFPLDWSKQLGYEKYVIEDLLEIVGLFRCYLKEIRISVDDNRMKTELENAVGRFLK